MKSKQYCIVTLLYTILAVILTYPLITKFSTHIWTAGEDTFIFLWNTWWVNHAVETGQSILHTSHAWYPTGASLAFQPFPYFTAILALPLLKILTPIAVQNLNVLLTFIIGALGAYLLNYHITRNKYASFIGGFIFAFAPYHFSKVGALNVVSIEWIPFFILFFIKLYKEPRIKYAILSAIFLTLTALSSWYYLVHMVLFGILMFFYYFITERKLALSKQYWINLFIFSLSFLLLISPALIPLVGGFSSAQGKADIVASVWHSTDLVSFVVPSEQHPLINTKAIHAKFTGVEHQAYLGLIPLALMIFALWRLKKKARFYFAMFLIFLLLSMGPALHFLGLVTIPVRDTGIASFFTSQEPNLHQEGVSTLENNIGIPLPYLIIYFIPGFQVARTPGRFMPTALLFLGILVALGITEIYKTKFKFKHLVVTILFAIIIFEYLSVPVPLLQPEIPDFYQTLPDADYAILELPQTYDLIFKRMYYQTLHEKPINSGIIARGPLTEQPLLENEEIVAWIKDPTKAIKEQHLDELRLLGFKYIVSDTADEKYHQALAKQLNQLRKPTEFDKLTVWEI